MSTNESLLFLIVIGCYGLCLIMPCKGDVITLEEHNARQGENFCATKAEGGGFMKLCQAVAKNHGISYDTIGLVNKCIERKIELFSDTKNSFVQTNEDLLDCAFNRTKNVPYGGTTYEEITQFFSRSLGRGKGPKDVMEYKIVKGVVSPMVNRVNFLTEVFG